MRKEKIVAILLALFLGMLGIHAFYLDNKRHGLTLLMLTLIGWIGLPVCALLTGGIITAISSVTAGTFVALLFFIIAVISILISFVWAFVDFIKLCVISDDDFNSKYNKVTIMNISE